MTFMESSLPGLNADYMIPVCGVLSRQVLAVHFEKVRSGRRRYDLMPPQ